MMTLSAPRRAPFVQYAILVAVILAILIINVVFTHNTLTAPFPGHNDFMSRWEGARSYWIDGLNPYREAASLNIQERIYGRAAAPDQDPGYFAYPFFTAFIIAPLVLTDYAWASAIWMVLLEVCLIGALFFNLGAIRWRPKPILLLIILIWALLDYLPMRGLLLGQPGLLVYFLQALALSAILSRRDAIGGAALALSTFKPQMGFLIVPLLILYALRLRRWRYVAAFTITFGVLMVASFVLQPSWLSDWLTQVNIYSSYTALGSPVWIIAQYYLSLGAVGEVLLIAPLIGVLIWSWYMVLIQGKDERFLWAAALTLTITHLIAPRTATPHYVVFTLPILFYMREITARRRGWLAAILLIGLTIVTWIHFLSTVQGEFEHPTLYLPLPIALFALLIVTRRHWWSASV